LAVAARSVRTARRLSGGEAVSLRPVSGEWLAAFAVLFAAVAAWAFATPLGAAPDEPAHLIRAASVARGQFLGKALPHPAAPEGPTLVVEVPPIFVTLANDVSCFQWKPKVPAGCQQPLAPQPGEVGAETYVGRYPPLYYALVGLPTLSATKGGIYGSRLLSGALSAALLALAVVYARRSRGTPLLAAGLALAMTPMTLYLAAVVNPSGLEIASATTAWAVAMSIRSRPPEELSGADLSALFTPLVLLSLLRPLGPLWVLAIGAALWALGLPAVRHPWGALLRRREAVFWLACLGAALVAALAWDFAAGAFAVQNGAPLPSGTGTWGIFQVASARLWLVLRSSVGDFGWLDTPSPFAVTIAWLSAFGAVAWVGLAAGRWRGRVVSCANLLAWAAIPVGLVLLDGRSMGVLGQGRDFMPLVVGAPIATASLVGCRRGRPAPAVPGAQGEGRGASPGPSLRQPGGHLELFSRSVVLALAVCQVVDFYWALRRYTVGSNGPLDAFATVAGGWRAPVAEPALVAMFVLSMAGFTTLLCRRPPLRLAGPGRFAEPPPQAGLAVAMAPKLAGAATSPVAAKGA
jgi:hypothetical protein